MAYKQLKLWFDKDLAIMLSAKINSTGIGFNSSQFMSQIDQNINSLELKDRVELIADKLNLHIEGDYYRKVTALVKILGPENQKQTGMFLEGYWIMPIAKFVEKYGLQHIDISLNAIEEITKRNTGEYAIRPFIENRTETTLLKMQEWAISDNFHIRRLSSEGIRIRLPWAKKMSLFIDDPEPILSIIELLKDDPIRYVQKSVANNLNDILKENYPAAKNTIDLWVKDMTLERKWIIKHALRNELKKENKWAVNIFHQLKDK